MSSALAMEILQSCTEPSKYFNDSDWWNLILRPNIYDFILPAMDCPVFAKLQAIWRPSLSVWPYFIPFRSSLFVKTAVLILSRLGDSCKSLKCIPKYQYPSKYTRKSYSWCELWHYIFRGASREQSIIEQYFVTDQMNNI